MKRISLFFALFIMLGLGKSFAGSINFVNLTACSFTFPIGSGTITNGSGTFPFIFGPFTINPGNTSYASVTSLPGFNSYGVAATGDVCAEMSKVVEPGMIASFPIGKTAQYHTYSSTNNPTCNNGVNYTMTWNIGSNGCDAVILVF